jgi:hypothetical protein
VDTLSPPPVRITKESGGVDTQCVDDFLPTATRMAFQQPAAIPVMNAEAVVSIGMSRAAGSPTIAATANIF